MGKVLLRKFSVKYSTGRLTILRFGCSAYLLRVGCVKSDVSTGLYADLKRFIISRGTSSLSEW